MADIDSVLPVSPTRGANAANNAFFHQRVDAGGNVAPAADTVARRSFATITDGTNSMPTMDVAARAGFVKVTDGTNIQPTGDIVTRSLFVAVGDGARTAAVKAASTGAAATDQALVVRPMAATDGTNTTPTMDAAARRGFVSITDGTSTAAVKAASTGAAATDQALVVRPMMGTDGTNTAPTADVAARASFTKVTDGTNTQVTFDVVGRAGFVKVTDGTNTAAVKAASTQAAATDPAMVVRPMMPTDGTNVQPVGDAAARASFVKVTDGTNTQVTFDVAARAGFVRLTDGTNPLGTSTNPIFVNVTNAVSASEVQDYKTTAAVASAATDNHDYASVTTTFLLKRVFASASGAIKVVVSVGPVASLVAKAAGFTSMANPNLDLVFDPPLEVPVASTGTTRVAITNRELSAMDVYSTIYGTQ